VRATEKGDEKLNEKQPVYALGVIAKIDMEPTLAWQEEAKRLIADAKLAGEQAVLTCPESDRDAVIRFKVAMQVPLRTAEKKDWPVAMMHGGEIRIPLSQLRLSAIDIFKDVAPVAASILRAEGDEG
jgi:hypothetical protein